MRDKTLRAASIQNVSQEALSGTLLRRKTLRAIVRHHQLYWLLLPAVVWYILFNYVPLYGIQIAFRNYNPALGIMKSEWVGLKYFFSFFRSHYFELIIKNTLILSFYSLIAGFPIPILFALMLNEVRAKGYRQFVQTVAYAPHFISTVVLVGALTIFLSPSTGMLSHLLTIFGHDPKSNLLSSPTAFRHIYVWSGIWQNVGWDSIIYIAALSAVDPALHEAASIDGASRMQRVLHINLPVLMPTMSILLILNLGSVMGVGFEKVFLLQNGMNSDTSEVISTYIYKRGLIKSDFSFSTAVGLFNNLVNFILLVSVNAVARRVGDTSLF